MRAILGNRRVRWGPWSQSSIANRDRIVDCSQWQVGFSRDRVFPSYLLATDVTEDDRVVSPQRAGVARDRLNDRAAIVEVPTFRPLTRVRICYGRSWRRRAHVAEYKCATFVSVARRRIPESLSPCDAFVEEARAGGELPAQSTRHVIGRFSCIRTS